MVPHAHRSSTKVFGACLVKRMILPRSLLPYQMVCFMTQNGQLPAVITYTGKGRPKAPGFTACWLLSFQGKVRVKNGHEEHVTKEQNKQVKQPPGYEH